MQLLMIAGLVGPCVGLYVLYLLDRRAENARH